MATLGMLKPSYGKLGTVLILCFSWSLLLSVADSQVTDPDEVDALLSIRGTLIDPNGHLARWDRRRDPCTTNWVGVICYNDTLDDGYLHVRHLFLLGRNLTGTLSPELGRLSQLMILDFMWNNLTGSIPREIGNIATLELLLLSGNNLTGSLPDELGNLSNLDRIQIDQNHISGPIPPSFANLTAIKHFHMNNNSLSGQIPPNLHRLPNLVHILFDNNNLSGSLPPELSEAPNLLILQLDNNNFSGSSIPSSYGNMSLLLKLSLRNCSLQGPLPTWSNLPAIAYIDLSLNQLTGPLPTETLSENITTIDLSSNNLNGTLPASFASLPLVQRLSVANNSLSGSIPAILWQNRNLNSTETLFLDFGFNAFENISGTFSIGPNVTIGLQGNPVCTSNSLLVPYCGTHEENFFSNVNITSVVDCPVGTCPPDYEYAPENPLGRCICYAPLYIGYRLKSPGFSDFIPYFNPFLVYLSSGLGMNVSQVEIGSIRWQQGPRLRMYIKLFPPYVSSGVRLFNRSEVTRIRDMFGGWTIPDSEVFGPFELLNFTLTGTYREAFGSSSRGISKGALIGIILGAIAGSVALSGVVFLLISRRYIRKNRATSKRRTSKRISMKLDGVKDFTFKEMSTATSDFASSSVVGEGGYGKVYRGVLANGTVVAIKRAQEGSLQGEKEFLTEIELLSRLHHRNLVSLIGYCDEHDEQMLVYEFMPNGTLRDNLSGKCKVSLNFAMRVKLALASAKGILYLHTEADPPIFHRDIKASNILLDSNFTAKVADFGLSRLAPVPVLSGDMPTHVSTVVKGTPGYLDPEYFLTHQLTDKSDVYSLGVVFLELLTGMHPIQHGKNIVREVNNAYRIGMIFSVVDEQMGSYPSECVEKFINLALKCCQEETSLRPSMTEVVRELENIWSMMPDNDTKITEFFASDPGKVMSPASSSTSFSYMKNMYASQDVSGSDLVSGAIPTVTPR